MRWNACFWFLCGVLLAVTAAAQSIDPGAPWPRFEKQVLPIPPAVAGSGLKVLARGDLNRDGLKDLVVVWWGGGQSTVALYLATDRTWESKGGQPFKTPRVLAKPDRRIDQAVVCDMDRDGKQDVLLAALGSPELLWLTPGAEKVQHRLVVPGAVTALAALDWGRRDLVADPVVAVEGASGPALVLFPADEAAIPGKPDVVALPTRVEHIVTGNLDGDAWWDLAMAGEKGLYILHGFDTAADAGKAMHPLLEKVEAGEHIVGVSATRFLRQSTHDLTALTASGLVLEDAEHGLRRADAGSLLHDAGNAPFFTILWEGAGRGPAVLIPGSKGFDLAGALTLEGKSSWRSTVHASVDLGGEATHIMPMRRNLDGLDDLVVALAENPRPMLLLSESRNTYTITTVDDHDDGACTVVDCTLREAINAANNHAGADLIATTGYYIFDLSSNLPSVMGTTTFDLNSQGYWYVRGSSAGGSTGLWIQGDSCMVYGLWSQSHQLDGLGNKGVGILLFDTLNTTLHDVHATDCASYGIELYNAIDCSLNAGASNNSADGFFVYRGGSGTTSGNTLDPIFANTNGGHGILIQGAPDTTIGGTASNSQALLTNNSDDGIRIWQSGASGSILAKVSSTNTNGLVLDQAGASTVGIIYPGADCFFSGNQGFGIEIENSSVSHRIANCEVGFLSDWSASGNDTDGIRIWQSSNVTVTQSVISNNGWNGVDIYGNSGHLASNNTVMDSIIGSNKTEDGAAGNTWYGVNVEWGTGNFIGTAGHGNVIVSNGSGGIRIYDYQTTGNVVRDNLIGLVHGSPGAGYGNSGHGVWVEDAPDNVIGPGNIIAYSTGTKGEGIVVKGNQAVGVNCSGNSIHDNGGLGIDLGADGVTLPDSGDGDEGPNHLMNQPLLMWVESCGANTYVSGKLDAAASPLSYTINFYSNTSCDASGMGEGLTLLGTTLSLPAPGSGEQRFRTTIPGSGAGVSLTALTLGPFGSTSEFSNCQAVTNGRPGDADGDCDIEADDVAGVIRAATEPGYVPPGNADADNNGTVEDTDVAYDVAKIFW